MDWKHFKEQGCLSILLIFGGAILLMVAVKLLFF
jgi:hypothetical protein